MSLSANDILIAEAMALAEPDGHIWDDKRFLDFVKWKISILPTSPDSFDFLIYKLEDKSVVHEYFFLVCSEIHESGLKLNMTMWASNILGEYKLFLDLLPTLKLEKIIQKNIFTQLSTDMRNKYPDFSSILDDLDKQVELKNKFVKLPPGNQKKRMTEEIIELDRMCYKKSQDSAFTNLFKQFNDFKFKIIKCDNIISGIDAILNY